MTLTFGSLFAGIGGFELGLERAGMVCKWQVEIDPFCQKVLVKHWPHVERFSDVRECGKHNLSAVDLICGGFPCQPFSEAGEQRGEQDDRNLWPEMRRAIDELRPRWVLGENVPGIRNLYLDTVLSDLAGLDYTAGTVDLPAIAFGAPHIRHRLFIIAHANGPEQGRREQPEWGTHQRDAEPSGNCKKRIVADAEKQPIRARLCQDGQAEQWRRRSGDGGCESTDISDAVICSDERGIAQSIQRQVSEQIDRERHRSPWAIEPAVGRVAHGVPNRVDRLRALGNAVVPQVAEWIGRRILEAEEAWQHEQMLEEERQQQRYDYNTDFVEAMT